MNIMTTTMTITIITIKAAPLHMWVCPWIPQSAHYQVLLKKRQSRSWFLR